MNPELLAKIRQALVDRGNETHAVRTQVTTGLIPFEYDQLDFSNPDSNGNYQTLTVKSGSTTKATITLTYDGNSKLTNATRA
jgi:hypothetical protein